MQNNCKIRQWISCSLNCVADSFAAKFGLNCNQQQYWLQCEIKPMLGDIRFNYETILTGLSSVTSHPKYSATVIIWFTIQSISWIKRGKNRFKLNDAAYCERGYQSKRHILLLRYILWCNIKRGQSDRNTIHHLAKVYHPSILYSQLVWGQRRWTAVTFFSFVLSRK